MTTTPAPSLPPPGAGRQNLPGSGRELVLSLYRALASRDLNAVALLLDPDVTWRSGETQPLTGGTHRGRIEVVDHLAELVRESSGTYDLAVLGVYGAGGDRFIVRHRESARVLGRSVEREACLRLDLGAAGIRAAERFGPDPV